METSVLYVTVTDIDPNLTRKYTYPDVLLLTEKFINNKPLSEELLQRLLKAYVIAGTHLEVMKLLVERGANVNFTYAGGEKLLHIAHNNANPNVIDFLLKNGAILTPSEQNFFREISPNFAKSKEFLTASNTFVKPDLPDLTTRSNKL